MRTLLSIVICCAFTLVRGQITEQPTLDPSFPQEYEIGGITVSGTVSTDPNAVKLFTGLQVGDKITVPGETITRAIKNLWDQKLFSDVRVDAAEIRGSTIFLNIIVVERPRLSRYKFEGVSKGDSDKLRDEIELVRGQQVNQALIANTSYSIEKFYRDKGFLSAKTSIVQNDDTLMDNSVWLLINVDKGPKVKIKDVIFHGNENIPDRKLRKAMKKTKRKRWRNIFGSSKFIQSEYRTDKAAVIELYKIA